MTRHLIITAGIIAVAASAFAQENSLGTARIYAGVGDSTPLGADLKLNIATPSFVFRPFVGIKSINNDSSARTEDISYIYTSTGNAYTSHTELRDSGYEATYGATFSGSLTDSNKLSASVRGTRSDLTTTGFRQESVSAAGGSPVSSLKSVLDLPSLVANTLDADVSLSHLTGRVGEELTLRYEYSLGTASRESSQDVLSQNNFSTFNSNWLSTEAKTQWHKLTASWERALTHGQKVRAGLRYENRSISTDDLQRINEHPTTENVEHFAHDMQTGAVFAEYSLRLRSFSANARLEYDYTDMNGKALHDVVPMANVRWQINPANALQAAYVRRIVRPGAELLNPFHVIGAYTIDYGIPTLQGIHLNNASLAHVLKTKSFDLTTTIAHIFVQDGFNAIWIERGDNIRLSFWGNEGIRRAWSFTPDAKWRPAQGTDIALRATLLWDKRIAEAINMEKEHWGIDLQLRLQQQLPLGFRLGAKAGYSEGNTIDLYSHGSRATSFGGDLTRDLGKHITLRADYCYADHARTILTQGSYTGFVHSHPDTRHAATFTVTYRL